MEEYRDASKPKARPINTVSDEGCDFLFEKIMTKTDISHHHQRLIIPKSAAASFFPNPGSMIRLVVPLLNVWDFEFNVWKDGKIHVIKGWHTFVSDNNLHVGDVVRFFQGSTRFEFTLSLIKRNLNPELLLMPSSTMPIKLFGKWVKSYGTVEEEETEDAIRVQPGKGEEEKKSILGSNSVADVDINSLSFLIWGPITNVWHDGSGFSTVSETSSSISASMGSTIWEPLRSLRSGAEGDSICDGFLSLSAVVSSFQSVGKSSSFTSTSIGPATLQFQGVLSNNETNHDGMIKKKCDTVHIDYGDS